MITRNTLSRPRRGVPPTIDRVNAAGGAGGDRLEHRVLRVLLPLVVAGCIFLVGLDGGAYSLASRSTIAILALWALVMGVGLRIVPLAPPGRAATVTGILLAAFAAWIGLSLIWAPNAEKAFNELNRAVLFLAVFALVVAVSRRASAQRWIVGVALGLVAVALLALASRLFPGSFPQGRALAELFPSAERRLSYPVNYWNGVGVVAAFAVPLLLALATSARATLARAAALAPIPALAATIYLTSSRGAAISALLAVVAFLALTARRWTAASAIAVAGTASALALWVVVSRPELVNEPFGSPLAAGQGRSAALLIALISLASAGLFAIGAMLAPPAPRVPRLVAAVFILAAVATLAVGAAAARPLDRLESFKRTPENLEGSVESHLFSTSGNGRWQMWQVSFDQFESRPLAGQGAGSYEVAWAQQRTSTLHLRNAHSLYVETLGELGAVGLALLLALFGWVAWVIARRLSATGGDDRVVLAGLAAVFVAFVFEVGVDWVWQVPAVSLVGFVVVALAVGPATRYGREPGPRTRPNLAAILRAVTVSSALVLMTAQAIPFLANVKIDRSEAAAARGDLPEAASEALAARDLQPWASSPYLQIALVGEQLGEVDSARAAIRGALERNESDWRLWLVASRLATKAGDFDEAQESLARAMELNPRSLLFSDAPTSP